MVNYKILEVFLSVKTSKLFSPQWMCLVTIQHLTNLKATAQLTG